MERPRSDRDPFWSEIAPRFAGTYRRSATINKQTRWPLGAGSPRRSVPRNLSPLPRDAAREKIRQAMGNSLPCGRQSFPARLLQRDGIFAAAPSAVPLFFVYQPNCPALFGRGFSLRRKSINLAIDQKAALIPLFFQNTATPANLPKHGQEGASGLAG